MQLDESGLTLLMTKTLKCFDGYPDLEVYLGMGGVNSTGKYLDLVKFGEICKIEVASQLIGEASVLLFIRTKEFELRLERS